MTDLETLGPPPRQVPLLTVLTLICHGPLGVIGWVFLGIGMLFASFTMSPSAIALGLVLMVDHEFVDGTVTAIEETSVSINEAEVLAVHVTVEDRLLREDGRPSFSVNYYAVNKNGDYGGAAIYSGARFAVSVDGNSRLEDSAYLFERG